MITYIIIFLVSVCASLIGAICGVGGGIIIKPALDSFGILNVSAVSFLSGCTVLTMTSYSVIRSKISRQSTIDVRTSSALAIGAVVGGIVGKDIFQYIWSSCSAKNTVGLIQSIALVVVTLATLIYTLKKSKIQTHHNKNIVVTIVLGFALGTISSFLGIGGGPINLVVLFYFFSMEMKVAAQNSLYIILFAQSASLISNIVTNTIPHVSIRLLVLMIFGGLIGGIVGQRINKTIREETVSKLFTGLMSFIILVNIYNIIQFSVL